MGLTKRELLFEAQRQRCFFCDSESLKESEEIYAVVVRRLMLKWARKPRPSTRKQKERGRT